MTPEKLSKYGMRAPPATVCPNCGHVTPTIGQRRHAEMLARTEAHKRKSLVALREVAGPLRVVELRPVLGLGHSQTWTVLNRLLVEGLVRCDRLRRSVGQRDEYRLTALGEEEADLVQTGAAR